MRVVFWDIDGTLLTTARAGILALEDAAREVCGVNADFSDLMTAGLTDGQVARLAIEECGRAAEPATRASFLRSYESHLPGRLPCRRGRVLPNVRAILEDIGDRAGYLNLLLTGNTIGGARAKLKHYGLGDFLAEGGFCAEEEDRAEIARHALAAARERCSAPLRPHSTVVIGDTPRDIESGRALGARTIAVATGEYSASELKQHRPTATVEELPPPASFRALLDQVLGLSPAPG